MGGSDQYPFIPKQRTISQELPSTTTQRTRNDTKACLILKLPKNDRYVSKKKTIPGSNLDNINNNNNDDDDDN